MTIWKNSRHVYDEIILHFVWLLDTSGNRRYSIEDIIIIIYLLLLGILITSLSSNLKLLKAPLAILAWCYGHPYIPGKRNLTMCSENSRTSTQRVYRETGGSRFHLKILTLFWSPQNNPHWSPVSWTSPRTTPTQEPLRIPLWTVIRRRCW